MPRGLHITEGDILNINNYYELLLDKPAVEATVDELLDCLNPDNPIERIMYRREVSSNAKQDFIRLNKGEKAQASLEKSISKNDNQTVGFKHLKYEVAESNGDVTLFIEKKINKELKFRVKTIDGTAKAGDAYVAKDEVIVIPAG